MSRIKSFALFEKSEVMSREQIEFMMMGVDGKWELDEVTGLVNVQGSFNCSEKDLQDFKGIRFGKVTGSFRCDSNLLKTLDGAPEEVGVSFYCDSNRLKTLKGAPRVVGGSFDCSGNQLTSLKGAPEKVGGNLFCGDNQLKTLEGAPREIGQDIYCEANQLTSFEGSPEKIGGSIYCEGNQLTSLEGAPVLGKDHHLYAPNNPVDPALLEQLMKDMKTNGGNFSLALRDRWDEVTMEDKVLMFRPEFKWVSDDEARKLKALAGYKRIEGMI